MGDSEIIKKIKELTKVKHLMSEWESHPRGKTGPKDGGGFIETMEVAAERGWDISPKRAAIIEKIYAQHILGQSEGKEERPAPTPGNASAFTMGKIEGVRSTEGWRLKIEGVIVGQPLTREHAYIVAGWLDKSLDALEEFLAMRDPASETPKVEDQVEEL